MWTIAPKGTKIEFMGEKTSNVTRGWYIKGGTFCARCRIKYTFDESVKLYLRDEKLGRNGPRCPYCGQMVRTRSKAKPNKKNGFWGKMEYNLKLVLS